MGCLASTWKVLGQAHDQSQEKTIPENKPQKMAQIKHQPGDESHVKSADIASKKIK